MPVPLVSVVIPAFDSERFLGEAIDSVLGQTYRRIEIIIVDDGSTDGTASVAESYGGAVTLVRQPNAGPAAARNAGFAASAGAFIGFHDADDVMVPEKIETQLAHLMAHPEIGGVLGEQDLILEDGAELPYWARGTASPLDPAIGKGPTPVPGPAPAAVTSEPRIHTMSVLIRRDVFEQIGGFDESMRHGEDVDLLLRMVDADIETARLPGVVVRRRVHEASLTQDRAAGREAMFRTVKARMERKRRMG